MPEISNIQWFPGHMAKTRRELKENLKQVDLVAEILDARIPCSSSNPEISELLGSKPCIKVLNKSDLSSAAANNAWVCFYKNQGTRCVLFSSKSSRSRADFLNAVNYVMKPKTDALKARGIINRNIRIMVVGIPNVGKSTFINKLCKNSKAKAENRPGVTRKTCWFTVDKNVELLDTPGVLWPKFESKETACNLAFTGAIKDDILDIEDIAVKFIEKLNPDFIDALSKRFKLDLTQIKSINSLEILNLIGKKRGMLISGGKTDTLRTANMLFEEFRSGKLGKITLEYPQI